MQRTTYTTLIAGATALAALGLAGGTAFANGGDDHPPTTSCPDELTARGGGPHPCNTDPGHDPVTICHRKGNGEFVVIVVDDDGTYDGHGNHEGDIIPAPDGGCPTPTTVPDTTVPDTTVPDTTVPPPTTIPDTTTVPDTTTLPPTTTTEPTPTTLPALDVEVYDQRCGGAITATANRNVEAVLEPNGYHFTLSPNPSTLQLTPGAYTITVDGNVEARFTIHACPRPATPLPTAPPTTAPQPATDISTPPATPAPQPVTPATLPETR